MVNRKIDLVWIIPEIIVELIFVVGIPIYLLNQMSKFGIFTFNGIICLSIVYLLIMNIKLNGIYELLKVE